MTGAESTSSASNRTPLKTQGCVTQCHDSSSRSKQECLEGIRLESFKGVHAWDGKGKHLDLFIDLECFPIRSPNLSSSNHWQAPKINCLIFKDCRAHAGFNSSLRVSLSRYKALERVV